MIYFVVLKIYSYAHTFIYNVYIIIYPSLFFLYIINICVYSICNIYQTNQETKERGKNAKTKAKAKTQRRKKNIAFLF